MKSTMHVLDVSVSEQKYTNQNIVQHNFERLQMNNVES